MSNLKLIILTSITMAAFAANSLLCRLVLMDARNSPISFTQVRLFSGAIALLFFLFKYRHKDVRPASWYRFVAPLFLFSYALCFSLAYVQISAGTGALILFGSVQLTMIVTALFKKQKLSIWQIVGVALAMVGFVILLLPGIHAPPVDAAVLMAIAGISWGLYSLAGQRNANSTYATALNFVMTLPIVLALMIFLPVSLTYHGWIFAVISGAVTSAFGYVLWYSVLKQLETTTAAVVQLCVPALATFGGVLFLGETLHSRLIISSLLIFLGIVLKVKG
ncbi:MAG: DMT family transporter [Bdellovibrio sp.]|nr:DMT family transporter [Bdellovibrio sp.]